MLERIQNKFGYRQFIEYPLEDEIQKLKRYASPNYDHDTSPYNVIATYPYHNENDIYNLYLIYKDNTQSSGFAVDERNKIVYVVRNILEYREENEDMIIVPLEYLRILDLDSTHSNKSYGVYYSMSEIEEQVTKSAQQSGRIIYPSPDQNSFGAPYKYKSECNRDPNCNVNDPSQWQIDDGYRFNIYDWNQNFVI